MGMDLAKKTFRCDPERFIAGANIPIAMEAKEAGADLAAHAPVLLTAGKATPLTAPAEGKEVSTTGLYGITAESAKTGEDAIIYLTGEFFAGALVLPDGVEAGDIEVPLRNIGIFLK